METSDKPVDIPLVSLQFVEKPLGPLIRKEAIQIIILPGKESVEIHFPLLLSFGAWPLGLFFFFYHAFFFIGYSYSLCQPASSQIKDCSFVGLWSDGLAIFNHTIMRLFVCPTINSEL